MRAGRAAAWSALVVLFVLLAAGPGRAQTPTPQQEAGQPTGLAPVLLVLDASGSMNADDGTGRAKIEAAKEALRALVTELPEGSPVGLRVYGHRVPNTDRENGCRDTELIVPVGPLSEPVMLSAIDSFSATGFTPIGESLRAAMSDLPTTGPRTVVLVSDGIDTCAPPDPCQTARELAAANVELRVEAVGFQADEAAAAQLRCIAEATGGQFRPVANSGELLRALREYQVSGAARTGASEIAQARAEAVTGAQLLPGQYRSSLAVGEEQFFTVEVRPGETLRAAATVVGGPSGRVSPSATFNLEVRGDDVLGDVSCGVDEVERIGQEARQVRVDGLEVAERGLCTEPGTYTIGMRLDDTATPSPIEGEDFDVELNVAVVDDGQGGAEVAAASTAPLLPLDEGPDPLAASGPTTTQFVLAGLGAAVLGALVGALIAWRMDP